MSGFSVWTHLAAAAALLVNLWIGGDFVDAWWGRTARNGFELLLIFGYAVFVLGVRVPFAFWRRPETPPGERSGDGRDER